MHAPPFHASYMLYANMFCVIKFILYTITYPFSLFFNYVHTSYVAINSTVIRLYVCKSVLQSVLLVSLMYCSTVGVVLEQSARPCDAAQVITYEKQRNRQLPSPCICLLPLGHVRITFGPPGLKPLGQWKGRPNMLHVFICNSTSTVHTSGIMQPI